LESECPGVAFAPRHNLLAAEKGQPLVLWSVPPSPGILNWLLETTQPSALHLCGQNTSDDSVDSVIKQIASLCKYALARDGLLNIGRMAARLGTTEAVVRHGLLWLEHRGMVKLVAFDPVGAPVDSVQVVAGNGQRQDDQANLVQAELEEQLAEVRAYRRFFLRAKVSELGIGSLNK
jgi:single-stranded-DNA-specific exonuclease